MDSCAAWSGCEEIKRNRCSAGGRGAVPRPFRYTARSAQGGAFLPPRMPVVTEVESKSVMSSHVPSFITCASSRSGCRSASAGGFHQMSRRASAASRVRTLVICIAPITRTYRYRKGGRADAHASANEMARGSICRRPRLDLPSATNKKSHAPRGAWPFGKPLAKDYFRERRNRCAAKRSPTPNSM